MHKPLALKEPMPMPDPSFPVKLHKVFNYECGETLFPHHWHEHLEFIYVETGSAVIECSTLQLHVQAGDLVVVNSNELHYGISTADDLYYYCLIADLSLLQSHFVDAVEKKFITPIARNLILFENLISRDADIADCMIALVRELNERLLGYELSIKSHLYRLLSLLVRKYVAPAAKADAYRHRQQDLERFHSVFQYVDDHYHEKITVDQLAALVRVSRVHFSRLFKQLTNKTITEYINLVRINRSEDLLRSTGMNVSEIAIAAGFSDVYYFSRMFKRLKKVSPKEWRNLGC
nr:AraC family transcriptional regulator [Paenibacillus sp. CGMCC 1.18879]